VAPRLLELRRPACAAPPQEHPHLPGPHWLSLHPCNTATALALALGLDDAGTVEPGATPAAEGPGQVAAPFAAPGPPASSLSDAACVGGSGEGAHGPAPHTPNGGSSDDAPDLDELLSAEQARSGSGAGASMGTPAHQREWQLHSDASVGPSGVRWLGGEVPWCPSEPTAVSLYMRAWLSLVSRHVGL
jgi:hypothetical protein